MCVKLRQFHLCVNVDAAPLYGLPVDKRHCCMHSLTVWLCPLLQNKVSSESASQIQDPNLQTSTQEWNRDDFISLPFLMQHKNRLIFSPQKVWIRELHSVISLCVCSTRPMPQKGQDRSFKGAEGEEYVLI